jgi:hypothetical protein
MNDDEIDAEDEAEYEAGQGLETEEALSKPNRAKLSRVLMLGGFGLSVLLGGALGIIGSKIFAGPDKTIALRAELQQSLDDLQKATQTQTKNLGATNSVQKQTKMRLNSLQAENRTLASQVVALEKMVSQVQSSTDTNLKTFTDRITVLEALTGENADVFNGADSIASRLDALEKAAIATEFGQDRNTPEETSAGLVKEEPSVQAEDVKRISAIPPIGQAQQSALSVLIDTFPRAKMLAVVKAQEQTANKKVGWLKRALSRHVRVGNDNAPDPYATIDAAESALKNGQITAAIELLAQLNPPVRTSAAEWIQAAQKAAPTLE